MRRRRAKIAQCTLAKEVWIALALLCKVDDSLGDYFDGEVVHARLRRLCRRERDLRAG